MKRKALVIGVIIVFVFSLTACSANDKKSETDSDSIVASTDDPEDTSASDMEFEPAEATAGGWKFTLEEIHRDKSMNNVSVVLGYTNTTTNSFTQEAEEGKEYFLVKMILEKEDGTENIEWDKLLLKDAQGNGYTRCDDVFLSDLGMQRLPGTALNFGSNEGWIGFEINEDAEDLTLEYSFEEDIFSYTFE